MRITSFSSFKNICENYVPFVSQGFQIAHLIDDCSSKISIKPREYTLLGPGSLGRTVLLMIPIFGNLIVFVCDLIRQHAVNQVTKNGMALEHMCSLLKNDPEVIHVAITENPNAEQFVSNPSLKYTALLTLDTFTKTLFQATLEQISDGESRKAATTQLNAIRIATLSPIEAIPDAEFTTQKLRDAETAARRAQGLTDAQIFQLQHAENLLKPTLRAQLLAS